MRMPVGASPRNAPMHRCARGLARLFRRRHRAVDERGSALVEFALAAPILLSLIFGLIEVCIALYTWQMVSEVAREGTRYAIVRGATCTTASGASCTASAAAVNSFVSSSNWPNIGGGTVSANTTFPDGNQNAGSRVQVTASYTVPFKIAFVRTSPITMSSTSVMYILQ
jgi:Flp pilus assembly protein TadG